MARSLLRWEGNSPKTERLGMAEGAEERASRVGGSRARRAGRTQLSLEEPDAAEFPGGKKGARELPSGPLHLCQVRAKSFSRDQGGGKHPKSGVGEGPGRDRAQRRGEAGTGRGPRPQGRGGAQ